MQSNESHDIMQKGVYYCLLFIPPTTLLRGDMRLAQYITC